MRMSGSGNQIRAGLLLVVLPVVRLANTLKASTRHGGKMRLNLLLLVVLAGIFAGCEAKPAAKSAPVTKTRLTAAQWQAALDGTFKKTSVKDDGDGKSSYMGRCTQRIDCAMFVKHDAFGRFTTFTPIDSEMMQYTAIKLPTYAFARSFLYLPDCGVPRIIINSHYFSKNTWMFMNHLAVLADNHLLLDRQFPPGETHRDYESYGLEEDYLFQVTPAELQKLRSIGPDTKLMIRVSGDKGYLSLDKKVSDAFQTGLLTSVKVLDLLASQLEGSDVSACT
jgi:hypothetical protein